MRRKTAFLLVLGLLALLVGGCGGGEEAAPTAEEVQGTVGGGGGGGETATEAEETEGQETEGQETEGQETAQETGAQGGGDAAEGDASKGKSVYASAGCGGCHVFEAAGSNGTVGPNLDESEVDYEGAVEQIRNGGDGMPPFKDQLNETQIKDVAAFVVAERGGGEG